ncbi:MAG: hypothetical protein K0R71_879 [Bacillales bacterium]|nr:hypothetical protein [Bacillales bacterium]
MLASMETGANIKLKLQLKGGNMNEHEENDDYAVGNHVGVFLLKRDISGKKSAC